MSGRTCKWRKGSSRSHITHSCPMALPHWDTNHHFPPVFCSSRVPAGRKQVNCQEVMQHYMEAPNLGRTVCGICRGSLTKIVPVVCSPPGNAALSFCFFCPSANPIPMSTIISESAGCSSLCAPWPGVLHQLLDHSSCAMEMASLFGVR